METGTPNPVLTRLHSPRIATSGLVLAEKCTCPLFTTRDDGKRIHSAFYPWRGPIGLVRLIERYCLTKFTTGEPGIDEAHEHQ